MRGVFGLLLIIIGAAVAWLIIIGKFPPKISPVDTSGYSASATSFPDTSGNTTSATATSGSSRRGGTIPT